jgi:transcriptional regulator with PAS, ATPase and Fis domain
VDIRLITATNKDLKAQVRSGLFREDLYYRINVISIQISPLRSRKEDIGMLVDHFIAKYSHEMGKQVQDVSSDALSLMTNYPWPGNVRELQNVIERAILISDGTAIGVEHLPEGMSADVPFQLHSFEKKLSIEDYTKAFIKRHQGEYNEKQVSEMLGITRKSLWEKRKKWGIARE